MGRLKDAGLDWRFPVGILTMLAAATHAVIDGLQAFIAVEAGLKVIWWALAAVMVTAAVTMARHLRREWNGRERGSQRAADGD